MKKQIWGLLEDYGLLQKTWHNDIKKRFFKDFMKIFNRFAQPEERGIEVVYEDIDVKEM